MVFLLVLSLFRSAGYQDTASLSPFNCSLARWRPEPFKCPFFPAADFTLPAHSPFAHLPSQSADTKRTHRTHTGNVNGEVGDEMGCPDEGRFYSRNADIPNLKLCQSSHTYSDLGEESRRNVFIQGTALFRSSTQSARKQRVSLSKVKSAALTNLRNVAPLFKIQVIVMKPVPFL